MIVRVVIFLAIAGAALAQSPSPSPDSRPVLIQLPNSEISDFIKFYQSLTKRKVWVDVQLRFDRTASIMIRQPIPRAEAIALIKDTLRKEGVEIREVGDSEAYVSSAAP
jgi:hypothetical protein